MSEASGFTISVYFPSGDPEGLRIIDKPPSSIQGLTFPRLIYPDIRDRKEFQQAGVYVLWSRSEFPRIYVGQTGKGQTGSLRNRLNRHLKDKDKYFWDDTVAFIGHNLLPTHFEYIESKLYQLAQEANVCELKQNYPKTDKLSDAVATVPEQYLKDMRLCLRLLGINFFEKPRIPEKRLILFLMDGDREIARGHESTQGFLVLAGARASKTEQPSIQTYLSARRKDLVSRCVLKCKGEYYELVANHLFRSPSDASGVLLGRSSSGRQDWKDDQDRSLAELAVQAAQEA